MLGLAYLSSAVRKLADQVLALSDAIGQANASLRQRLLLNETEADPPALEHQETEGATPRRNGRKTTA